MKPPTLTKASRFIAPAILAFPFIQSLYICPFILPWIVCSECPVFSCLMNPRTTPIRKVLLVNFVVSGLLAGRVFCSWMCPYGSMQELSSVLSGNKVRIRLNRKLMLVIKVSVFILAFLIAFCLFYPILLGFAPQLNVLNPILSPIYHAGFSLTMIFLNYPWIIGFLRASLFLSFLGISMLLRRSWCRICPLGTLISIFNKVSVFKLKIFKNNCIKCDKCFYGCQMDLNPLDGGVESIECIRCFDCIEKCPRKSIGIGFRRPSRKTNSI